MRGAILVAIGYPSDTPLDFERRAFDLSPPQPAERNVPPQGGQDVFLDFIEKRLMPEVNSRFKVDQDQRSLVGWSFGGMFGPTTEPESLRAAVAGGARYVGFVFYPRSPRAIAPPMAAAKTMTSTMPSQ